MREFSNFDLTNYNSYRLKAICKKAYFPETEDDIKLLYSIDKSYVLLGSGHNVILSRDHYNESFIIFNGNYDKIMVDVENEVIEAEAGVFMADLCEISAQNSLSGLEVFFDIPSSFGGAIVMNAGASGVEIKDLITCVTYLDLNDMTKKTISNEDASFEYRNSFFQRNKDKVVLKGWLKLASKSEVEIREKMSTIKEARWAKQPKEFPNAGSVFKRPPGHYVGAIMDDLNLKGFSVGGAKVSEKHGGFIVNFGNATGSDVLAVINEVKKRVFDAMGIELEVEQRII